MLSSAVVILSYLCISQAAPQQWHPFLQMFYKPASSNQIFYNGYQDRNADYSSPYQEDSYTPVNYRPPTIKPVYGLPATKELISGSSGYQGFSRASSTPLFNLNPTYSPPVQNNFLFPPPVTQGDASSFQHYERLPTNPQLFFNSREREDLYPGQQYQSDPRIYDRSAYTSDSSFDRSYHHHEYHHHHDHHNHNNHDFGHSYPQPSRPYGSPDRNTYDHPQPSRPYGAPDRNTYDRPQPSRPYGAPDRNTYDRPQPSRPYGSPDRNTFNRPQPDRQGGAFGSSGPMDVLYSWKQVDFEFPNEFMREDMIRRQQFIPRNNLILDMDVYEEGSNRIIFVTLPRVRPGVPVTLATVSPRQRRGVNLLVPFPDWQSHVQGDCENGITSVFRTHIDICGRLWVLDSGNNNAFQTGQSRIVCPPQVLLYDLRNNNRLIRKWRIPESMVANNSLMVTINVDSRSNDCRDDVAYIADSFGNKLLVFNLQTQQFWRTNSSLFYPYPDQTNFSVNGVDFMLSGGIFGLALSPLYRGERRLYFHCIDSVKQSYVDTSDLQDPRPWMRNVDANPRVFKELEGERTSQSAAAAMDENGIMYFGLIGSNQLACWNSATDFGSENIVILGRDDLNFQFNSGIKVYRDKLYAVTNRLQNYVTNQVRENEENYRVLVADIRQLVRGTKCDVRQFSGFGNPQHHSAGDFRRNSYPSQRSYPYYSSGY